MEEDVCQRNCAGRPRKMSEQQLSIAVRLYYNEGMPVREVADAVRVSHMTVWRALNRLTPSDIVGPSAYG